MGKTKNEKVSEAKRRAAGNVRKYGMSNRFTYMATFTWAEDNNSLEQVQAHRIRIEKQMRLWGGSYLSVIAPHKNGTGWHLHMLIGGTMYDLREATPEEASAITVKAKGTCYLWLNAPQFGIGHHVIQEIGGAKTVTADKQAVEQAKVVNYLAENARQAVGALRRLEGGKRVRILHTSRGLAKGKAINYETESGESIWLYDNVTEAAAVVMPESAKAELSTHIDDFPAWEYYDGTMVRIVGEYQTLKKVLDRKCKRKTYRIPSGQTVYVRDQSDISYIVFRRKGNEDFIEWLGTCFIGYNRDGNDLVVFKGSSAEIRTTLELAEWIDWKAPT